MYLGYQKDIIVAIADTKEELLNIPMLHLDYIERASERYVYHDGKYVPKHKVTPQTLSEKNIEARKACYPSIADQLDMLYWDKKNKTSTWEALITQIKKLYPKG